MATWTRSWLIKKGLGIELVAKLSLRTRHFEFLCGMREWLIKSVSMKCWLQRGVVVVLTGESVDVAGVNVCVTTRLTLPRIV